MIFWSLSALIWFKNMKKMLLQMTSGFLQLESTIYVFNFLHSIISYQSIVVLNDIRAVSVIFNMLVQIIKSIQKSKNHQRRIFLDNYFRQRCLV
jgi:hypothetical protein